MNPYLLFEVHNVAQLLSATPLLYGIGEHGSLIPMPQVIHDCSTCFAAHLGPSAERERERVYMVMQASYMASCQFKGME